MFSRKIVQLCLFCCFLLGQCLCPPAFAYQENEKELHLAGLAKAREKLAASQQDPWYVIELSYALVALGGHTANLGEAGAYYEEAFRRSMDACGKLAALSKPDATSVLQYGGLLDAAYTALVFQMLVEPSINRPEANAVELLKASELFRLSETDYAAVRARTAYTLALRPGDSPEKRMELLGRAKHDFEASLAAEGEDTGETAYDLALCLAWMAFYSEDATISGDLFAEAARYSAGRAAPDDESIPAYINASCQVNLLQAMSTNVAPTRDALVRSGENLLDEYSSPEDGETFSCLRALAAAARGDAQACMERLAEFSESQIEGTQNRIPLVVDGSPFFDPVRNKPEFRRFIDAWR